MALVDEALAANWLLLLAGAAVAVATGLVALVLLAANPRRNWNQWLAFYLVLVCGNFVAGTLAWWIGLQAATGQLEAANVAAGQGFWHSVGFAFLILDPLALVVFASIFPRRGRLADSRWALPGLLVLAAAFLALEVPGRGLSAPGPGPSLARVAFFAYLALGYLYAVARLFRSYLGEPSSVMATQVRVVCLGVAVAALPRVALLPSDLTREILAVLPTEFPLQAAERPVRLLLLWVPLLAAAWWIGRSASPASRRTEARGLLRILAAVFALFSAVWVASGVLQALSYLGGGPWSGSPLASALDGVTFGTRWLLFAGAIVVGVVRYEVLAANMSAVGVAAILATGAGSFAVAAAGAAFLGPWGAAVASASIAAALAAVLVLGARRRASSRVDEYLRERSLEVYRSLLASSLAGGGIDGARERDLARARERLGVGAGQHEALLAIAEAEERGRGERRLAFGRYEVLRRVGAGGYASVDLARDVRDGRLVVLKHFHDPGPGRRDDLEAAAREVEVARRVSHPNLVAIHDLVRLPDGVAVVMEYVEGGSLRDLLEREGPLPGGRARAVLQGALAGLAALHEAGIVHGDVKPENILLTAQGDVRLADFGTARAIPTRRTLERRPRGPLAAGTPGYLAPEQARGAPPSPSTDLYALGAVAYEVLAGRLHAPEEGGRRGTPFPDVPEAWRPLLRGALERTPSARFRTAAAMAAALPPLADGPPGPRGVGGMHPAGGA